MPLRCLLGLGCLFIQSCGSALSSYPHVRYPDEALGPEYFLSAPIILIATITSVRKVGNSFSLTKNHLSAELQLLEIQLSVETTLKGEVKPGTATVNAFAVINPRGMFRRTPPVPTVGRRMMLFLRYDGKELRFQLDVGGRDFVVHSGFHSPNEVEGETVEHRILYSVLVPGQFMDRHDFAETLDSDVIQVAFVGSPSFMLNLLTNLSKNADGDIRYRACTVRVERYYGQEECLVPLLSDPNQVRSSEARRLLNKQGLKEEYLLKTLKSDPLYMGDLTVESAAEALEMLTQYPKQEVRKLACAALRHSFPRRDVQSCLQFSGK